MKIDRPPSEELIQLLADYDLKVGELALALRDIVVGLAPTAIESLFKSYAASMTYSFTGKWTDGFCMIVVYPRHVNLGFNRGAELEDPDGRLEGTGKVMRHIKVKGPDDLKKSYLKTFIREAIKKTKLRDAERAAAGKRSRTGVLSKKRSK